MIVDKCRETLWYKLKALAKDEDKNKTIYEKVKAHPTLLITIDKAREIVEQGKMVMDLPDQKLEEKLEKLKKIDELLQTSSKLFNEVVDMLWSFICGRCEGEGKILLHKIIRENGALNFITEEITCPSCEGKGIND